MNDLTITRLCAEAMGHEFIGNKYVWQICYRSKFDGMTVTASYDPLLDDAQAMALVKKLDICVRRVANGWYCSTWHFEPTEHEFFNEELNAAICTCVAKIQQAKVQKSE